MKKDDVGQLLKNIGKNIMPMSNIENLNRVNSFLGDGKSLLRYHDKYRKPTKPTKTKMNVQNPITIMSSISVVIQNHTAREKQIYALPPKTFLLEHVL